MPRTFGQFTLHQLQDNDHFHSYIQERLSDPQLVGDVLMKIMYSQPQPKRGVIKHPNRIAYWRERRVKASLAKGASA